MRIKSYFAEFCFIGSGMVRALMTMVERCAFLSAPSGTGTVAPASEDARLPTAFGTPAAVTPEPAPPSKPRFTPAEIAFVLSVSN
jgi:hypothetical protein